MHVPLIIVETGSTLTKVHAFNPPARHLGMGMALTTVTAGVQQGIVAALADLARQLQAPELTGEIMLANSSAAGGLTMTVHGLTYDMTARAGREASLGAGAIVRKVTAGEITAADLEEIAAIQPNIILLCGGVDYGEHDITRRNAERLARVPLQAQIIFAGNCDLTREIQALFQGVGRSVTAVKNVYPAVDQLEVEPARHAIREIFGRHIIQAKGMRDLAARVQGAVIPTPAAVLKAGELLYRQLGDILIVDIGGATTDVHSVTEGSFRYAAQLVNPEPLAKRSVEADLGVYINAAHLAQMGDDPVPPARLAELKPIPMTEIEKQLSRQLARKALRLAVRRHAGKLHHYYDATGRHDLIKGRDLTAVKWILGTGGALARLGCGAELLAECRADRVREYLLPPATAQVAIDDAYMLSALGTLAFYDAPLAQAAVQDYCARLGCPQPNPKHEIRNPK